MNCQLQKYPSSRRDRLPWKKVAPGHCAVCGNQRYDPKPGSAVVEICNFADTSPWFVRGVGFQSTRGASMLPATDRHATRDRLSCAALFALRTPLLKVRQLTYFWVLFGRFTSFGASTCSRRRAFF